MQKQLDSPFLLEKIRKWFRLKGKKLAFRFILLHYKSLWIALLLGFRKNVFLFTNMLAQLQLQTFGPQMICLGKIVAQNKSIREWTKRDLCEIPTDMKNRKVNNERNKMGKMLVLVLARCRPGNHCTVVWSLGEQSNLWEFTKLRVSLETRYILQEGKSLSYSTTMVRIENALQY